MSRRRLARSTDALLALFADRRRRAIVRHLSARDGRASLDALVEAVSTEGEDERERRIGLHHRHLPQLADAGAVEYDLPDQTVRYRPHEQVESLLGFLAEEFEGSEESDD